MLGLFGLILFHEPSPAHIPASVFHHHVGYIMSRLFLAFYSCGGELYETAVCLVIIKD